jgi:flagellar biosynthesis/type III secretory pathway protein FliH
MMAAALTPEAAGLAGLLTSLQPRVVPDAPLPDLDAIRAAGWQAGFAAADAAAEARLAPVQAQFADAAAALDAACCIDVDALRPLFIALVHEIARAVLMAELGAGATVLEPLVIAALAAVKPHEAPTLEMHPETLAALQPYLPAIATAANAAMARDAFAVTGPQFVITAGLTDRLADIVAGLA